MVLMDLNLDFIILFGLDVNLFLNIFSDNYLTKLIFLLYCNLILWNLLNIYFFFKLDLDLEFDLFFRFLFFNGVLYFGRILFLIN